MTNAEIDALIAEAGLADVVRIFDSAIEIDPYNMDVDGYSVLARLLLAEREACARIAESFIPSGFRDGSLAAHTHKLPMGDLIGIARDDRARVIASAIRAGTAFDAAQAVRES